MKLSDPERRSDDRERSSDSRDGLLMRMELRSDPALLCAVRGAVERLTESFGFSAPECRAVTRAVDEALTNIIRHAYCGRADQPIELSIRSIHRRSIQERSVQDEASPKVAEGLEILLCDRGPAIQPEQMCKRALEEVRPGGLGLHFIQQSMDVVEYTRAKGTNCLRLVKYVHAPKQDQTS
jgi:serine/threonine-protein kinase RsbW